MIFSRRQIAKKDNSVSRILQRAALFFCSFVLVFTIVQPVEVMALGAFQPKPGDVPVRPLTTAKPAADSHITKSLPDDQTAKLDAPLKVDSTPVKEDESKRTPYSSEYINRDGTRTLRHSTSQQNFEEGGKWKKINNTLTPEKTTPPPRTFWEIITFQQKEAPKPKKFSGEAGVIDVEMLPFAEGSKVTVEGKTIHIKPVGADNVWPERKDDRTVIYRNAWRGVDVEYQLRGEMIKEVVVVKDASAPHEFNFTVAGGKLIAHPTREGELAIEGIDPDKYSFSALTVDVNGRGVISEQRATQTPTKHGMRVTVDKDWLRSLPKESFPLRIDPSFYRFNTHGGIMFKSDGYRCNPSNCFYNVGAIHDRGWKYWRTFFTFDYNQLRGGGKKILHARLQLPMTRGVNGDENHRTIHMAWAKCLNSFHCVGDSPWIRGGGSLVADINFTQLMQWAVDRNWYDSWFALWGEEGHHKSYKTFHEMHVDIVYDTPTPVAQAQSPADKQVVVDTQPTLQVGTVKDGDGEAVQYRFRVSANRDGGGAIVSSGWQNHTQWTVPEGVLQDGTTYYWRVDTKGVSNTGTETLGNWVRSFKVDLRKGKNNSQTYDTVGPMSIDLATGNATTEEKTHTMSALGGDIGVALHYNTTASSEKGLLGKYWNISQQDATYNKLPSGKPLLQRTDKNINFNWGYGSPGGAVATDWFYSQWQGYFVPPKTGEYIFGTNNDDVMQVRINDQAVVSNGICTGICYGTPVRLEAGKPVKIEVRHAEATAPTYAKLYVKGVVAEQIVPHEWLRTPVMPKRDQYGLKGHYYRFDDKPNFPVDGKDPNYLLMVRNDTKLSFNWGLEGPAPGMTKDKFMVRWTGYVTAPKTGKYQLGTRSDDGTRITIGGGTAGSRETVLNNWSDQAVSDVKWSKEISLIAGKKVPITVEYYDHGSLAQMGLYVKGTSLSPQEMPEKWLTPQADALPDGWKLGLDVDGNVSYDRLRVAGNNVILEDASGTTYEYTWTGSGFKPPKNEDGHLVRNADNTYTLLDTDGRQYIFRSDGQLKEMTTPEDDRKPAALRYEYAGDPSHLVKIIDGVNAARYGELFYKGVNERDNICATQQGFDTTPTGYLCAFKTSDDDITKFHYKQGHLARIEKPGKEFDDYGYDELGRLATVRDAAANDAVAYKIRDNDATITTELTYDSIGRIQGIKAPAATAQSARNHHTFTYESITSESTPGATQLHIEGASEPHGFSKRVEYDKLFRTTKETDLTGKTITTQWHENRDLQLAKTDAKGLKSTTIYNDDDMPVEQFGPAPKEWFGADNRPLAAHVAGVPRTETRYDEGIKGPAVAWYGLKSGNMTLHGAPLYHSTGFASNNPPENGRQDYMRHDFTKQSLPFKVDATKYDGYGFIATGKLRLPQTGTYTFDVAADDSVKLLLDDREIISNWGTKTKGAHRNSLKGTFQAEAGKLYRFEYRYGHEGMSDLGSMGIGVTGPGLSGDPLDWSRIIAPAYNLQTTQKAYDAQAGDIETKTIYKNPAYGQVEKTVLDPTGLNYESKAEYEPLGAGYLRQTSKTLPGGAKTTYLHYGAADMVDNPCTPQHDPAPQAGRAKGKIEPDPDGSGLQQGRRSETIYNHSGDVLATRYNDDPWTCTEYDARGRVTKTVVPDRTENGQVIKGRTITNAYAANNNPLITTTTDESGTITVENDLLGRTIKYTDAKGHITLNTYDDFGKLTKRTSPLGTETYEYDQFDRLVKHKLDGVTFATVVYDEFSDIQKIDYPAGIQLSSITRDSLGRENGNTYTLASGQTLSDQIERYVSGDIKQGVELGIQKSYTYDNAGRLTSARLGDNTFNYEFGTPHESCTALPGSNPHTAKSGNRTKLTMNGKAITFCYDHADRLVSASDPSLTNVQYDSHGNTISLGDAAHTTEFTYDAADRNIAIRSDNKQTRYVRDAQDRILSRTHTQAGTPDTTTHYGFTGSGDTPDFTTDAAGNLTQKYLTLPGDVLVTITPNAQSAGATTFSLPNIHGDIFATINADGSLINTFMTGPFGEALPNQANPTNTTPGTTYHYVGQHQKLTETNPSPIPGGIIQMGARVYLPILGRFLQVDPVEGGGDNTYVYVNDPVNHDDLDGRVAPFVVGIAWHLGRVAVQHAIRHAVKHSAKHAVKHVTKRVATNAAKKRVQWSAGKFHNAGRNAAYHYNKHARSIGARSQKAYNRSARNTVRRHIDYHRYRNGRIAYLDKRGRITVVNRRGNYVTHYKPLPRKLNNHWRNVRGK